MTPASNKSKNAIFCAFGFVIVITAIIFVMYCLSKNIGLIEPPPMGRFTIIFLHDDKVLTVQPDNSITVLDAETGKINLRGDTLVSSVESSFEEGFIIIPYGKIMLVYPKFTFSPQFLVSMNEGAPIVTGEAFTRGMMEVYGDQIFCLVRSNDRGISTVSCLDTLGGVIVWEKEVNGLWNKISVDKNQIYLYGANNTRIISVYDKNMEYIATNYQVSESRDEESEYLNEYYPDSFYSVDITNKLKNTFGDEFNFMARSSVLLPNDGIIAVSALSPNHSTRFLHFSDGMGHKWRKPLNSHGHLGSFDDPKLSVAMNDRSIIYASNYGRIECRDIMTGNVVWSYAFPRRSMEKWKQEYSSVLSRCSILNWVYDAPMIRYLQNNNSGIKEYISVFINSLGMDFYTEDKQLYDRDINSDDVIKELDQSTGMNTSKWVIDNKTVHFDVIGTTIAMMMCWLSISITILTFLSNIRKSQLPYVKIKFLMGLIAINLVVILFFGRYDRSIFRVLWYSVIVAYIHIGFILIKGETDLNHSVKKDRRE